MDFLEEIRGNERQKAFFRERIEQDRLSHAYILEAPQGAGKKMLALRIAASLAYRETDSEQERTAKCRRILDGASPDVRILRPEEGKKSIGVAAVRDFMASVYLSPSELGFQMYVLDEADKITPQAQNALLKVIEEPWRGVYIFLLCENSMSLLATVRSRAQKVVLETFDESELSAYARETGLPGAEDAERLGFAVRAAHGAIGRLRRLLENGETEYTAYLTAKKAVEGQAMKNRGMTYYAFLSLLGGMADSRELLEAFAGYLLSAYRDLARGGLSEGYAPEFWTADELQSYLTAFSSETVSMSFAAADRVLTDLRLNTSLPLSAAVLAIELWNAA